MSFIKKKITLSDSQKYELCLYADKHKLTRTQYINWIKKKWGVKVDKSTITQILKNTNKRLAIEVIYSEQKETSQLFFLNLNSL